MTLSPETRARVVEAMARAYPYWPIESADSQDAIREYCRGALDAALPLIVGECVAKCAGYMDGRATEIRASGSITAIGVSKIFEDEAEAIRALAGEVGS